MLNEELHVFKVTYVGDYMDMSLDFGDGPRWSGKYIEGQNSVLVVAPTGDFASAYVISTSGERDGGSRILGVEDLGECVGIVELIGSNGKRPSIVRPFVVQPIKEEDESE